MIRHVFVRAGQARGLNSVALATPDARIAEVATGFGAQVVMTAATHLSGTDRLAEAARLLGLEDDDIVVNIQGDEPMLDPASIEAALQPLLRDPAIQMTSLMCRCPLEDLDNPACVKVVCAVNGNALYFSRNRIPFPRNPVPHNSATANLSPVRQHIGLYAYRQGFLQTYSRLAPTPLERIESLEQLRVLEHGYAIRMVEVEQAPIGVDTPEDLERARQIWQVQQSQQSQQ